MKLKQKFIVIFSIILIANLFLAVTYYKNLNNIITNDTQQINTLTELTQTFVDQNKGDKAVVDQFNTIISNIQTSHNTKLQSGLSSISTIIFIIFIISLASIFLIGDLSKLIMKLQMSTFSVKDKTEQINQIFKKVKALVINQNENIQSTQNDFQNLFLAIKEINASLDESSNLLITVGENSQLSNKLATEALKSQDIVELKINDNMKEIKHFIDQTNQIQQITKIMQSIVTETHLLSINAAIEASKNNDSGGFKVIANEINKLSNFSKESLQKIEALILDLNKSSNHIIDSLQSSENILKIESKNIMLALNSIKKIPESLNTSIEHLKLINQSTKDQFGAINNINDSLEANLDKSEATYTYITKINTVLQANDENYENLLSSCNYLLKKSNI